MTEQKRLAIELCHSYAKARGLEARDVSGASNDLRMVIEAPWDRSIFCDLSISALELKANKTAPAIAELVCARAGNCIGVLRQIVSVRSESPTLPVGSNLGRTAGLRF